uniref:Uncharacterized protein n=1 Tax=Timema genevievae TaxID=629358 RepID=A0A7R9K000_TIMGE|nr:unnamed protein product [Timema genevievae]
MEKQLQKQKIVRQKTTVTLCREERNQFCWLIVTEEAESSDDEEEEVGYTTQPTIKVSEVKDHLNFVIQYVEQSANENVFAYYEHLQHFHQLLPEEISSKQTQQKINYFFKPMNVSNQHEPGPPCSKD